jgi:hypothetical protein
MTFFGNAVEIKIHLNLGAFDGYLDADTRCRYQMGTPGRGGCVSWENLRNLLKRNGPIWHQLGK